MEFLVLMEGIVQALRMNLHLGNVEHTQNFSSTPAPFLVTRGTIFDSHFGQRFSVPAMIAPFRAQKSCTRRAGRE
jgi:hypothetical protein